MSKILPNPLNKDDTFIEHLFRLTWAEFIEPSSTIVEFNRKVIKPCLPSSTVYREDRAYVFPTWSRDKAIVADLKSFPFPQESLSVTHSYPSFKHFIEDIIQHPVKDFVDGGCPASAGIGQSALAA